MLKVMHDADPQLCHIGEWRPPQWGVKGSRWVPVYFAGPGKDAKLTKAMKKEHVKEYYRRWRAANTNKPRLQGLEAALYRDPSKRLANIQRSRDEVRGRVLAALANLAPHHSMPCSSLGHVAFPGRSFKNLQGAVFAWSWYNRDMQNDALIEKAPGGYVITSKGRAMLERLQASEAAQ